MMKKNIFTKGIFRNLLLMSFILIANISVINCQIPVLKVDLNEDSRNESEVNEPGYIPWPITSSPASKTIEGVTFTFKNGGFISDWYKTGVQAPYYARLANDGLSSGLVELHITGLQNGKHTLITFHNTIGSTSTKPFGPLDIYVNDILIVDNLEQTNRVLANDSATTAYLEFEVTDNDTIVIKFEADKSFTDVSNSFVINGFHLNSSDPKKMAKFPFPDNLNEHVNIDNDTLIFQWAPPANMVSQNIYLGTDKEELLTADITSPAFLGNQTDTFLIKTGFYSMNTYYWRVDPVDANGDTTKGDVWSFKKRIKSFPGADGYGGYAIGGRSGKVVYVSNLEDYKPDNEAIIPGSFRAAVENESGPRTIIFNVSGLITLKDRLVIRDDYITIAGQTAPGKGVCFRWAPIGVTGDDLIVQNLRVRLGIGITYDGMGLTGSENSIIDHCSVSWTIDEAVSSRGAKNITLQRTLISEALNAAGHSNYPDGSEHGYAGSIGGDVGSFHHNLLAHCNGRNWSMAGGLDGDGNYAGRLDLFNNIVYNWGSRATDGGAHEVNFVNNYYKKGAATTQSTILKAQLEGTGGGSQSYYVAGNIVEEKDGSLACDGTDNTCSCEYDKYPAQVLDWDVWVNDPFFPSEATIHSAKDAYKQVLSDVGCTQPVFDDHDIRIVNETLNGKYTFKGSRTGKAGFPDNEKDVGYWEEYPGFLRDKNWDTDLDGLPNWWEKANGLDTNTAKGNFSDANADEDKNGYTNLEEYLHWISAPHYFMNMDDNLKVNLKKYSMGFTNSPVFTIDNITGGNATIIADTSVEFTPSAEGLAGFEFTVTDAENSTMTRKIGIYVGQIAPDSAFTYTYDLSRPADPVDPGDPEDSTDNITQNKYVKNINIYPNPVNNILNVCFESINNSTFEIAIMNLTGSILYKENNQVYSGYNSLNIDLTKLSAGIYYVNMKNSVYNKTIKIIKQ